MADRRKTCFVLMPFAEQYREVYDQVYMPVCEANGLRCWRVDEVARPGSITQDIVEGIIDADILIADLTSQNANVFYELGIAHATGNKVIMTSQSADDIPFDIASYRVVLYEQTIAGSKALAEKLEAAIKELLAALDRTNNPVQSVLAERAALHFKRRLPLVRVADVATFTPGFKRLIEEEGIIYLDELAELDLEEVAARPGFGPDSFRQLAFLVTRLDSAVDLEQVYKILTRRNVGFTGWHGRRWESFVNSVQLARQSI